MRLIDADEVAKFPIRANKCDKENANEHFVYGIETVLEYVEQLPTIEPVKHGHWKRFGAFACECSVCKIYVDVIDANNYCGNCGARMDGEG